ncbi:MAG: methyltransferase domain-containing protein [Oscillospiraceae bacterium]|nr:methyltransferase domain-containing protein [Oscillospiraceae bacterium]
MGFWDRWAKFYDAAESLNNVAYTAMLNGVRTVVPEGAKVLDCAAGTGELSIAASEKAESVLCTDMSLSMLEVAEKKCSKRGIKNISFEERNILELPDPDDTYDIAMAGNVLHLIDDPQTAVKELARVVRNGGKLILPTFMMGENNKMSVLLKIYRLFGFRSSSQYTIDEYREMLESCEVGRVKVTALKGIMPVAFGVVKVSK